MFNHRADNCFEISGALTMKTVPDLFEETKTYFSHASQISIDLSNVKDVDSAGLAFFVSLIGEALKQKIPIHLFHLPQQLLEIARVHQVEELLNATRKYP